MNKTKIDWADSTWNPVTGCQHDCEYCYARTIAHRFGGHDHDEDKEVSGRQWAAGPQRLSRPKYITRMNGLRMAPYPWYFLPTFHEYRLGIPAKWSEPRTVFVGSMCDLFGDWVPEEWIQAVFEACERAPQHRYLFLTKNPVRYATLAHKGGLPIRPNHWYGSTITTPVDTFWRRDIYHCFVSIEPIHQFFTQPGKPVKKVDWVIVGAETGSRKDKVRPERAWIEDIAEECKATDTPLFMKESLRGLMGDAFSQAFPWQREKPAP